MDIEISIRHLQPQGYSRKLKTARVYIRSLNRKESREVNQARREDETQAWQAAEALLAFVSFTYGIPMEELVVEIAEIRRLHR